MRPRLSRLEPGLARARGRRSRPGGRSRRAACATGSACPSRGRVITRSSVALDAGDLLAEAERDVAPAQQVLQRDRDLVVDVGEQAVARVDERHARADRREHRRVLDADHAGADDGHRPRHLVLELQDPVRVDHAALVEVDALRARRARADRDHDVLGGDDHLRVVRASSSIADRVRVHERGVADEQPDVVAAELLADEGGLVGDDARRAVAEELGRGELGGRGGAGRAGPRCGRRGPRGSPGAASSTGSCRCGSTRRRRGRGARRRATRLPSLAA